LTTPQSSQLICSITMEGTIKIIIEREEKREKKREWGIKKYNLNLHILVVSPVL